MASPYAFVTLVSSDSYLPGALALVAAIHDLHPPPRPIPFQSVCLVTPESVDVSTIKLLRKAFDLVIGVEILEQDDNSRLKLLGRPDLTTVLTKLHVFRLTQYSKIIFFDADVLPIRPVSHLFELPHEFAAAPDVGWPDIFNSGVLVLAPGEDKFAELDQLIKSKGSWDGGDQGILNEWRGDNWHRLSFTYNTTPTAAYTYAPAYERYGSQISVIHFIGPNKPWKSIPYRSPFTTHSTSPKSEAVHQAYDYDSLVDRWFAVYDSHYRSQPVIPSNTFEVKHYSSAWDDNGSRATRKFPSGNTALSLDELKRLAIEGMNASANGGSGGGASSESHTGEGEYRSMPLEGRVDLMRPRKEEPVEEEEQEPGEGNENPQVDEGVFEYEEFNYDGSVTPVSRHASLPDDSVYWHTLPTPGPNEIPPSPRPAVISLPPTPTPQTGYYQESSAGDTDDGYFYGASPYQPPAHTQGKHDHQKRPPRRVSPQHSYRGSPPHHKGHHNNEGQRGGSPTHHPAHNREHHLHDHRHHPQHSPPQHTTHHHAQQPQHTQHTHGSSHQQEHHKPRHHEHKSRHSQQEHQQSSPGSQQGSGQQYHSEAGDGARTPQQEQRRPPSPPLLIWDPAKEPPPRTQPTPSAFPTDTYFQNVWDQTPSNNSHDITVHQDRPKAPESTSFFEPPPPSEIPDSLLREGHYRNVTGEQAGSPPAPDPTKVKTVFPWEGKTRQLPVRAFPAADAPKPSQFASPPPKLPPPAIASPSTPPKPTSPIRLLSPLGLTSPLSSTYSNAWDSVPSIQKYASKLVRPPPPPAPMFPAFDEEWRKSRRKSWEDRAEVSSRDGDDEDNADDEDDEEPQAPTHTNKWDDDDDSEAEAARRRSRRNSTASSYSYKSKKKEYRSRGVQTVEPEKRSQSIQVSNDPPLRTEQRRGPSGRRHWSASTSLNISSPTMQTARLGHDISVSTAAPSPMSEVPQGHSLRTRAMKIPSPSVSPSTLRSPREFIVSPVASVPQKSVNGVTQGSSTPPIKSPSSTARAAAPSIRMAVPQPKPVPSSSNSRPPSLVTRQISNDSSLPSPASSAGPISPSDGQPISPAARRAGRVWDPARGVELFKRSSEEVLARFLKMGSWEENGR